MLAYHHHFGKVCAKFLGVACAGGSVNYRAKYILPLNDLSWCLGGSGGDALTSQSSFGGCGAVKITVQHKNFAGRIVGVAVR